MSRIIDVGRGDIKGRMRQTVGIDEGPRRAGGG